MKKVSSVLIISIVLAGLIIWLNLFKGSAEKSSEIKKDNISSTTGSQREKKLHQKPSLESKFVRARVFLPPNNEISSGDFAGSRLTQVKCHRTICKIEIECEDENAKLLFFSEGMGREILEGPSQGFNQTTEDGSVESVIYIGKNGDGLRMKLAALERSNEIVTRGSDDDVFPTQKQLDTVAAARIR